MLDTASSARPRAANGAGADGPRLSGSPTWLPEPLRIHPVGDPGRAVVEAFVSAVYAGRYGARIPSWAPLLVSARSGGTTIAAAGYRSAVGRLYLERYLAVPIEQRIAEVTGRPAPARHRIVEVGHLAAVRAGAGRQLMLCLGAHLASLGFQWLVVTATPAVRQSFERIGVRGLELGAATAEAAGADGAAWGSYYRSGPAVMGGELTSERVSTLAGGHR